MRKGGVSSARQRLSQSQASSRSTPQAVNAHTLARMESDLASSNRAKSTKMSVGAASSKEGILILVSCITVRCDEWLAGSDVCLMTALRTGLSWKRGKFIVRVLNGGGIRQKFISTLGAQGAGQRAKRIARYLGIESLPNHFLAEGPQLLGDFLGGKTIEIQNLSARRMGDKATYRIGGMRSN